MRDPIPRGHFAEFILNIWGCSLTPFYDLRIPNAPETERQARREGKRYHGPLDGKVALDTDVVQRKIDVFVNNAGIVHAYGQPDTELDDCHTVYLTGIRVGMKAVLRGIQNARALETRQYDAREFYRALSCKAPVQIDAGRRKIFPHNMAHILHAIALRPTAMCSASAPSPRFPSTAWRAAKSQIASLIWLTALVVTALHWVRTKSLSSRAGFRQGIHG